MNTSVWCTRVARVLCCAVAILISQQLFATEATWIGGSSGVWSEPTNWSTGVVPNLATTNVTIDDDLLIGSVANLDQNATVGTFSIGEGDALGVEGAFTLVANFVSVAGDVSLGAKSKLQGEEIIWIQPTGELHLTQNPTNFDHNLVGPAPLWNQGRIDGAGLMGGPITTGIAVTNAGSVVANSPNQSLTLRFVSSEFPPTGILRNFNTGEMLAESGGTLRLEMSDAYNVDNVLMNVGGLIEARGDSKIVLQDIGIVGGRLSTTTLGGVDEGVIQFADTTLDGVLLEGNFTGGIVLRGSNVNNGLITANSFFNSVYVDGLTSLHGVGRLALTGGRTASLSQAGLPGDSKLINEKEHTIGGVGVTSANLQNRGLLEAHPQAGIESEILTVPGLSVNSGLVRARDGATLQIGVLVSTSGPIPVVANFEGTTPGVIEAGVDSKVILGHRIIQGGILRAVAPEEGASGIAGTFETSTSFDAPTILQDVRLEGTIGDSSSVWQVTGELENTGKLEAKNLLIQQQAVFTGGGEIRLNGGQVIRPSGEFSNSWINQNNVIGGSGVIWVSTSVINRGTIQADIDQTDLTLGFFNDVPTVNSGLLQATNGGVLIPESVVNYEGTELGTIHASDNSRVEPRRVEGGVLTTSGTGRIVFRRGGTGIGSQNRITNVHNQGTLQLSSTTLFLGNFRNDGSVLDDIGSVTFGGSVFRLTGNGTWTGNMGIGLNASINTLFVHEAEHTIGGRMNFQVTNGAFINRGTLIAEESSVITLDQGTRLTQEGIVRVPDSQFLEIRSADQRLTNKGTLEVDGYLLATRTNPGPLEFFNAGGGVIQLAGQFGLATQNDALSPILIWNQAGGVLAGQGTINLIEDDSLHTALLLNSGTIRPEGEQDSFGRIFTNGDFQQDALGRLELDLGGPLSSGLYDALHLQQADATLDGVLQISLVDDYVPDVGHSFEIITADTGTVSRTFSTLTAPALAGRWWSLDYQSDKVVLSVAPITADFDGNGFVDGDDLIQWQAAYGMNDLADADGDGDSDGRDFLAWQRQFGSGINPLATSVAVPEPRVIVCLLPLIGLMFRRDTARAFQFRFVGVATLISSLAFSLLTAGSVFAVDAEWIGGPAGNWAEPSNWSSGVVPNDAATNVTIDIDDMTDSAVILNQGATVGNLAIEEGDALSIEDQLLIANSATVTGSVALVNLAQLAANEFIWVQPTGEVSLSGTSTTQRNIASHGPIWNQGLIQGSGLIGGSGSSGVPLSNEGSIIANSSSNLLLVRCDNYSILGFNNFNTGEMRAQAGGMLHLQILSPVGGDGGLLNEGGLIEAQGDSRVIVEGSIKGGLLSTTSEGGVDEGLIEFRSTTLEGVLLEGNFSGSIRLRGTNENNGLVRTRFGSQGLGSILVDGVTTLQGAGNIQLGGGNIEWTFSGASLNSALTNDVGHTISGPGEIRAYTFDFVNRGLVDAHPQSETSRTQLSIRNTLDRPVTNSGIMRARDGVTLTIEGPSSQPAIPLTTFKNFSGSTGGVIEAGVDGTIVFTDTIVEGGTLRSISPASGAVGTPGKIQSLSADAATLRDVRLEGNIGDATSGWKLEGRIENTGTLVGRTFIMQQDLTFVGGGEMRLADENSSFFAGSNQFSWINEDNLFRGSGGITSGAASINRGIIQADVNGKGFGISASPVSNTRFINSGLLQAINGGTLNVFGGFGAALINFEGDKIGTVHAGNNSRVNLSSVVGGILTTAGTGVVSATQVTDVHNQGTLQFGTTTIAGHLLNDGNVRDASGTVTVSGPLVRVSGTGTWASYQSGTVALTVGSTATPATLLHEATHTIRGPLDIRIVNGSFRNSGTLIAEGSPTSRIRIEQGTMMQEGTLSVAAQRRLEIETRDQQFANYGITNVTGDIVVYRTVTGPLEFVNAPDATVNLRGAIRLDVLDRVNDATVLWNQETATFAGKGSIDLIETNGMHAALFRNSGLIRPEGQVGEIGTLTLDSDFQQDATGRLAIDLGGILSTEFDALILAGTDAVLGGSLDVSLTSTFDPAVGDSFTLIDTAGGMVLGSFDTFSAPALSGRWWSLDYQTDKVVLSVNAITADFDGSGFVDGDDLGEWQAAYGVNALADADGDGDTDGRDFLAWQRQFGSRIDPLAASVAVPEPGSVFLLSLAISLTCGRGRRA